ncbi:MAG: FxDxF family PEP-CTERM protein [Rubrivivax sp.]|nr:FxDxF family PEP-CTERM protein [Rubrivivax sp.]
MTSSFHNSLRNSSRVAVALAVLAGFATSSHAVNLLTNGSFEDETQANGTWAIYSSLTGWSGGAGGIELRNNVAGVAYDGVNYVELDTTTNSLAYQSLATGSNQQYLLTFAYSPRENVGVASNGIEVFWNNTSLGQFTGTGAASGNNWTLKTATVFGTGGLTELKFVAYGDSDSFGGSLDAVSLTAVPEPETYAMMLAGIGVVGFVAARRRRMM